MPFTTLSITIPSDVANVGAVRKLACALPGLLERDIDADVLSLLTTELVTNAVKVEAGDVQTTFTSLGSVLRVEVHDQGGGWPVMVRPQPLDENGGRGLMIVNALADSWGAVSSPEQGTTVWFEFADVDMGHARDVVDVVDVVDMRDEASVHARTSSSGGGAGHAYPGSEFRLCAG